MNWAIFIKDRFPPLQYIPMIAAFFLANCANYNAWSLLVTTLVFFHLRVFDEIKDYQTDVIHNPTRPLASGLISCKEAWYVALACIGLELALSAMISAKALLIACGMVGYSLLMYKEFFIGEWLRPKLATYALTHTLIVCWISAFLGSPSLLANWMVFNVFEFGRKTFGKAEQVKNTKYKYGELWVLFFAGTATALHLTLFTGILFAALMATAPWTKLFRTACSAFIFLYYIGVICA